MAIALIACCCCYAALPASAQVEAASTTATIRPSFLPNRLGASTAFTFALRFAGGSAGIPSPVSRAVVHLPAGLGINLRGAGVCSTARLRARGARGCAARTLVGRGHASLEVHAGSQTIAEPSTLWAYRGPNRGGTPTLAILGQGYTPLEERVVIVGVVAPDRSPYGLRLTMAIPPIPSLPGEPNASTVSFSLTIGATHNPKAHAATTITVPHSCPAGGFPFAAEFTFADHSTAGAAATARCP